jgi:hypothetical protein
MFAESSMEKNVAYIDKLNSDNYSIWCFKVKALMQEKEVWDVIEGEKPEDPQNTESTEDPEKSAEMVAKVAEWKKKDQKALNTIILTVSNSQIIFIKNETTAKGAWKALEQEHKKSGVGSKTRVFKKMFHTTLQKGASMREHLNVMLNYFDQLTEMGASLPTDVSVNTILASLNDDYSSVVTAIEAWDETRLTMKNVKSILIEEYEKKGTQGSAEIMKVDSVQVDKYKNMECGYCHKLGHIKKNCFKLKFNQERSVQYKDIQDKIKEKATEAAIKMIQNEESQDAEMKWYVDSGASLHICSNLSFFRSIQFSKESFKVANGDKVIADGVGTVIIYIKSTNNESHKLVLRDVLYLKNQKFSNIISVSRLLLDNYTFNFIKDKCSINFNKETFLTKRTDNGLFVLTGYKLNFQKDVANDICLLCIHEWHNILSHRNLNDIKKLKSRGIKFKNCKCSDQCEACIQG